MTAPTPLDLAHAAMAAAPDDDVARLCFFERFADAELFVLLEGDVTGDQATPRLFPVDGTPLVLAFDREERLSDFLGGPADFLSMSGRAMAHLLTSQSPDIGIGLNLGIPESEVILPPDALAWLVRTVAAGPEEMQDSIQQVYSPRGLPEALVTALDAKLALAAGMARMAYLAAVDYEAGRQGHVLAFVDAIPEAEAALARSVSEALTFSGIEAGALDVTFVRSTGPFSAALARHGLRFDLPEPEQGGSGPSAPGMDPDRPPRLR